MKYNKILILFSISLLSLSINNSIATSTIDKIAAIVNTNIILESDIQKIREFNIQDNKNTLLETKNNKLNSRKNILKQLISDTLILQLAQKMNINISDQQTNEIVNYIAKQNNMNNAQFRSHLTNNGINYDTYMDYVRKNTLINAIHNYEMHQRIKILPYEIQTLTKRLTQNNNNAFQLNHILIPLTKNPTKQEITTAYSLSTSLISKLKKGANIQQLIHEKNNKFQNIQIKKVHWSTLKELPTLFSETLIQHDLKINSVIGPIRSNVGLHILKINDIEHNINTNMVTIIHTKHITLKTSNTHEHQKNRQKLLQITKKIKNKETTFSLEAQQMFKNTDSYNQNVNSEWKYLDEFDRNTQKILQSLKKGEISPPIQTTDGWSIIQLIDTKIINKNETISQFDASQIIFNKKINDETKRWIQELKSSSYIKIFNENND
ncbi:chaperone surA [Blochmannia endosymbiont of Polyrhachis (Hedomyrma) turneri]|nr:chaperone surA [Blochmannia endosymbiont of Polyrhachis (Hedomyrma) turneri]